MNKKTSSYEQRRPEKTEQIRSRATDKVKKKELNDNPYLKPGSLLLSFEQTMKEDAFSIC